MCCVGTKLAHFYVRGEVDEAHNFAKLTLLLKHGELLLFA